MIHIIVSSILSALKTEAVGSRVTDAGAFLMALMGLIETHDTSKDRVSGQHFIVLPERFFGWVSAGVGPRSADSGDYVLRTQRGRVAAFLKRERAAAVQSCAVVVYTRAAYLADPDVQKDTAERDRINTSGATHVLVAVLASAGPKAPLTVFRFVHNLAGGNKEALAWSADEIRNKAAEVMSYAEAWDVVAD